MTEEWLIDGYNLLHFITGRRNPAPAFPTTKPALCALLAGFASGKKIQIHAVFDGTGPAEEMKVHEAPDFRAVYSQKVSADHYIEKYLYENRSSRSLTVVTDDRAITLIARGGGSRVLKNSQFLEMLKEAGSEEKSALLKEQVRSHGFHRPFDQKLKAKGL